MTERVITIKIPAGAAKKGGRDIEKALKGIKDEAKKAGAAVRETGGGKGGGKGGPLKPLEDGAKRAKTQFAGLKASVIGVVGAFTAGAIIKAADEYAALQGQLRLVTGSQEELVDTTQALFDISQETRQSLAATSSLYIRLARSTDFTAERIEALTSTIGKTVALSRAAPQAAQAALFQLGQGFAAGALRGEELNSVLEQTPELAKAIADGLKVTTGELRVLGSEGELTAEKVAEALEASADRVDAEFGEIPLTVGDAVTKVGNALTLFVGSLDEATGATSVLAGGIDNVAKVIQGLQIIVSGASGFGAAYDKAGDDIAAAEAELRKLRETASGFESTSQSNFGGFRIVAPGEREAAEQAIAAAIAKLDELRDIQRQIALGGGLTDAQREAKRLDELRTAASKAADTLNGLFLADRNKNQLEGAINAANTALDKLRTDLEKGLIEPEEFARLEALLTKSIGGASAREADAFVRNFEGARIKAEEQLKKLDEYAANELISPDVEARIRDRLQKALEVPPDPAIAAAEAFVDSFATAGEKAKEKIALLNDFIEKDLIDAETAQRIRDRLEAIVAKDLEIKLAVDVQAVQDTEQRIDDLRGKLDAFNAGGAEGLSAFESFIEARDIIAELGDNATVSVTELTALIETEKQLEGVLGDTTDGVKDQSDALEDFFTRARENSQDILAGFLADPLSEGLDELPLKFAKTLQALAAQALASKIFELLLGAEGTTGGGFFGAVVGAFGGGRANGGPVAANQSFVVGERGPELFSPSTAGTITSNENLPMEAPQVNVGGPTIINTIEDRSIIEAFNRGGGGEAVLNYVTENSGSFRQALGVG